MQWTLRAVERRKSTDYFIDDENDMPIAHVDDRQTAELMVMAPELKQEVAHLRAWIRDEGERTNVCTFDVLGEVCAGCRCSRAALAAAPEGEAG